MTIFTILASALARVLMIPLVLAFILVMTGTMGDVVDGSVQLVTTLQQVSATLEAVQ